MTQMLSDFVKPIQTISFAELAEALRCNESTQYRWLKDETIKLPKPIQNGKKKMCFIYDEIEKWLYSRPRFNSFLTLVQINSSLLVLNQVRGLFQNI